MADDDTGKSFETSMAELEAIVDRLESGELPLEAALVAFESGIGLVRRLNQRLSEAETRVEVLTRNTEGALQTDPLERTVPPKE